VVAARNNRAIPALALIHGVNDMYMGFLPALLPLIVQRLDLTLTGVGLLISTVNLVSQLSQPLFGYLGDRTGRRVLAIAGPLVTTLSMSWLGLVGSYELLLLTVVLGSLGTAVFHPQGAALVGSFAGRRGTAMAVFTSGGSIGYGVGPVLVIAIVNLFGLHFTWLSMGLGLAATAFLVAVVPRSTGRPAAAGSRPRAPGPSRWLVPLILLYSVVMLRAGAAILFTTFIPLLIERRGAALMLGGWTLLGFSLAGAVGGLLGGPLSDRLGRRAVTVGGLALTGPAIFLFLRADGLAAAALLLLSGVCLFSALPVNIVMAQELRPNHASTVSGLVMGFAWGIGGLATTVLGALADRWSTTLGELAGLARAMDLIAVLPIAAAILALALPETRVASSGERGSAAADG
jgi:FSR family fosmidomycin resistance protein-like MFS transporter